MKITQSSDNLIPVSSTAQSASQKNAQSASSTASTSAAKSTQSAGVAVTVSTLARTLGASSRGEAADVDMEKVNSVRAAIQKGTFAVNPEAIADKLLSNAQEMLNRSQN
jgi:negative regulator of flagellin synthesis FlgM